jgi:hypothetical protein
LEVQLTQAANIVVFTLENFYPMNLQINLSNFPLWQFLQQPVFSSKTRLILNPRQFEVAYKIELLERCWDIEYDSSDSYFNK